MALSKASSNRIFDRIDTIPGYYSASYIIERMYILAVLKAPGYLKHLLFAHTVNQDIALCVKQ